MGERRLSIAAATSFHVSLRIQGTSPHRRFHSLLTLKLLPHHRSISQPANSRRRLALYTTTKISQSNPSLFGGAQLFVSNSIIVYTTQLVHQYQYYYL
jgi:hypothetical protein